SVGVSNIGFGRFGDVADVVHRASGIALAIGRKGGDGMFAELVWILEKFDNVIFEQFVLQAQEFGRAVGVLFQVSTGDRGVFVNDENQARDVALDGAAVFKFGHGQLIGVPGVVRHVAVAVGEDTEVDF